VLGGTAWLWANALAESTVDILIVDESGQMSLANTLAISSACDSLVLLGDPMQLAQPSQASHPDGAGASALEHVLSENLTMPEDLGIFIGHTRRMHPDLTSFTSEVFYDGKLESIDGLDGQRINSESAFSGAGLRSVAVEHDGNASSSPEEAVRVAAIVSELLRGSWQDSHGRQMPLTSADVLIVTPFNAQIREIRTALEAAGLLGVMVGTVDKFQGREAPVTIYSLGSSSAELAPRGMEFLYQLNRLNVATSRARCISVIVSSPNLVRVLCKTPKQMRLANALCHARERAAIE
jgi:superfamily I DNA and/or RNA helicase